MAVANRTTCFCAFAIASDGRATELTELPTSDASPDAAFVWTHLHVRLEGAKGWLADEAQLDPTVVETMMAADTRPRAMIRPDGVMLIFRAMNLHEGEDPEEMILYEPACIERAPWPTTVSCEERNSGVP